VNRREYASRLHAARSAYFKVIATGSSTADNEAHAALAAFEREYPEDAVGKAYHGSLELLDAAHSWRIWNLHRQAADGISLLDAAVAQAPDEPEVRFLRAATDWHLPGFYHRRAESEVDFELLAGRAEEDARRGKLPPELAAAALSYWGQILMGRGDREGAKAAFQAAIRVAPRSPAGEDAARRVVELE
jgi:tetratricopeptide (TPR) repeat protein